MPQSAVQASTTRSHLAFALALQRAAAPDATRDSCWSPLSVASALGLVAVGARGQTQDELVELLVGKGGSLAGHTALLDAAGTLEEGDGRGDGPTLAVANTLWSADRLTLRETFIEELSRWANGSVRAAPFESDPDGSRRMINAEVAETTHDLIPELVPPGALDRQIVAVLVNALYLKTAWSTRFPQGATKPAAFHTPSGRRDVPTMQVTERLRYAAQDGWQVVALTAAGGVDAVVLLPDGELAQAEAELDAEALGALLDAPSVRRTELHLPKFDVSVKSPLTEVLGSLGVHAMFAPGTADLSGIGEAGQPMYVSTVLHQAVLRIDEQGLEGAAATAVAVRAMSMTMPAEPVVVRVDRPFLVLVRHRASGAVYFMARIANP